MDENKLGNEDKNLSGVTTEIAVEAPDSVAGLTAYGRHLSNIYDHRRPHAEMYLAHSFETMHAGPEAMRQDWQRHLDWIRANVIGPPKATETYTVAQLEAMDMIGIYASLKIQPTNTSASDDTMVQE